MNTHEALKWAIGSLEVAAKTTDEQPEDLQAVRVLQALHDALPQNGDGLRECATAAEERMLQGNPHPAWYDTSRGITEVRLMASVLDENK